MNDLILNKLMSKRDEVTNRTLIWASAIEGKDVDVKGLSGFFRKHGDLSLPDDLFSVGTDLNISIHAEPFNDVFHYHDFFELITPIKGSVVDMTENDKITLSEGDVCIHNPKCRHAVTDFSDDKNILLNVLISKKLFKKSLYSSFSSDEKFNAFFNEYEHNPQSYLVFKKPSREVGDVINLLLKNYTSETPSQIILESLLLVLFSELFIDFKTENKNSLKERIQNYIYNNFATCNLESTAEHFGYHPKYFCSLVKKECGTTFLDLLNRRRVQRVAYFLEYTNLSVEKIAEAVGYNDAVSLYINFKKYFKKTPLKYKKEM